MPKRFTKRKQNKRTKKRTNKYTNRKKTRRSVNIFSKYLGGGGEIIENLQPVIEIINNSRLREKIADCYVFSKKQPYSRENKTYVVFQLNKGIHNTVSSVSQGVAKGVGNVFRGMVGESWEQKSATYLLIEKLQSVLNNFSDKSTDEGMALGTKITGFSEKSFLTAKTLYVRMSSLEGDNQITCTNAAFNPQNPTNWINEVEPQETALDTLLEKRSQYNEAESQYNKEYKKAWEAADKAVITFGRGSSEFKAAYNEQKEISEAKEIAEEAKKKAWLNFDKVNKLTYFHYKLNEEGDYDKSIKAAVDKVQPSQPAPTTDQPEQPSQPEQPEQPEEQQPSQPEQ
jgi:hypothetical protein